MGTTYCQPMDASGGLPQYSATGERQALAALMGGGSGRSLGARPGFRVGTPGDIIAVTSTTWTAQKEFAAVLDPASSTTQGPYRYSYVPLPAADTGGITPADATYPRKDIIVIRVDDASAGDSSGARQAPLVYRAGAATSMTPVAPSLNAREFLVGTINMPQVGAGSPTFTINPAYFVAAGGIQPVVDTTDQGTLAQYPGLPTVRSGILEISNGSSFKRPGTVVQANSQMVGTGMAVNDFTSGTKVPMVQTGTFVGTTDSSGNIGIPYPVAFPNGVISCNLTNGDSGTGNLIMAKAGTPFTQTTSTLYVNVKVANTGANVASGTVRIDWEARGW